MVTADLVVSLVLFSLGLIGAFFGVLLSTKCEGKLRRIIIFLAVISSLFLVYEIGNLMQIYILYPEIAVPVAGILHGGVLVFTLFVLASISEIVSVSLKRRRR